MYMHLRILSTCVHVPIYERGTHIHIHTCNICVANVHMNTMCTHIYNLLRANIGVVGQPCMAVSVTIF